MIERIIDDINKALDAEAYMAALSLVLTLPDICAKAEYREKGISNKERYTKWYDDYIGMYEKSPTLSGETETPYLNGEVIYQLRCSVLHQGTPNVIKDKVTDEHCAVDHFTLVVEKKKPFDIYADASSVVEHNGEKTRSYRVNIRRLCLIITATASNYYKKNKDKFTFFEYEILDWDKAVDEFNRWNGVL